MKSWIFIGLLMAMLSGAAYYYYNSTQTHIAQLVEANTQLTTNNAILDANNKRLVEVNDQNLATIDELQKSYEQMREQYNQAQAEFQVIRLQNRELRERLGRHELDALAAARPGLVENVINNASDRALRCFELLSGSPLTEQERNASDEKEFNTECPWLYHELVNP